MQCSYVEVFTYGLCHLLFSSLPPSQVLDRLNPLLEPHGELLVNERGLVDGQPLLVRPHPSFRLFLALDPQYGEVSRAMRNRGVEIFLCPADAALGAAEASAAGQTVGIKDSWGSDLGREANGVGSPTGDFKIDNHGREGTFGNKSSSQDTVVGSAAGSSSQGGTGWEGAEGDFGGGGWSDEQAMSALLTAIDPVLGPASLSLPVISPPSHHMPDKQLATFRVLLSASIPSPALLSCMLHALSALQHRELSATGHASRSHSHPSLTPSPSSSPCSWSTAPTLRQVSQWSSLFLHLCEGGTAALAALSLSWHHTFVRPLPTEEQQRAASAMLDGAIRAFFRPAESEGEAAHDMDRGASSLSSLGVVTSTLGDVGNVQLKLLSSLSACLPSAWPTVTCLPAILSDASVHQQLVQAGLLAATVSNLMALDGTAIMAAVTALKEQTLQPQHHDQGHSVAYTASVSPSSTHVLSTLPVDALALLLSGSSIEEVVQRGRNLLTGFGRSSWQRKKQQVLLRVLLSALLEQSASPKQYAGFLLFVASFCHPFLPPTSSTSSASALSSTSTPATLSCLAHGLLSSPSLSSAVARLFALWSSQEQVRPKPFPPPIAACLPMLAPGGCGGASAVTAESYIADASSSELQAMVHSSAGFQESGSHPIAVSPATKGLMGEDGNLSPEPLVGSWWGALEAAANRVLTAQRCQMQWAIEDEVAAQGRAVEEGSGGRGGIGGSKVTSLSPFTLSVIHFRTSQAEGGEGAAARGNRQPPGAVPWPGQCHAALVWTYPLLSALRRLEQALLDAEVGEEGWRGRGVQYKALLGSCEEEGEGGGGTEEETGVRGDTGRGEGKGAASFVLVLHQLQDAHEGVWELVSEPCGSMDLDMLLFQWQRLRLAAATAADTAVRMRSSTAGTKEGNVPADDVSKVSAL